MSNPRKFSEKIALHAQKQAEGTAAFDAIMKEVSSTTKAALAKKIATKQQNQQMQQLLNEQQKALLASTLAAQESQQQKSQQQLQQQLNQKHQHLTQHQLTQQLQQHQAPSLANSLAYNSGHNVVRQEDFKGRSLPNVNQICTTNKPIDLQTALSSLEMMKHEVMGRRASSSSSRCVDKLVKRVQSKERSSSQPRKHCSVSRQRERSPYGSIYLSPPNHPSWRRVSSDSAIHTNVVGNNSRSASRIIINNNPEHVSSSDNIMVCLTNSGSQTCMQQQQSISSQLSQVPDETVNGRPRSCGVPGINIYPSEVAYQNNLAYTLSQQQQQRQFVFNNNNNSNNCYGNFLSNAANNNNNSTSSSLPNLPKNLSRETNDLSSHSSQPVNHSNLSKLCSILIQQDTLTEDNVDNMQDATLSAEYNHVQQHNNQQHNNQQQQHNNQQQNNNILHRMETDNELLEKEIVTNINNNQVSFFKPQQQQFIMQQQQNLLTQQQLSKPSNSTESSPLSNSFSPNLSPLNPDNNTINNNTNNNNTNNNTNNNQLFHIVLANDTKEDSQQLLLQYQKLLQQQQQKVFQQQQQLSQQPKQLSQQPQQLPQQQQIPQQLSQQPQQLSQQQPQQLSQQQEALDSLHSMLVTPQLTLQQPLTGNFFTQQYSPKHISSSSPHQQRLSEAASLQQRAVVSAVLRTEQIIAKAKKMNKDADNNNDNVLTQKLLQQQQLIHLQQQQQCINQSYSHSLQHKFQQISMASKQEKVLEELFQADDQTKLLFIQHNNNIINNNNYNNNTHNKTSDVEETQNSDALHFSFNNIYNNNQPHNDITNNNVGSDNTSHSNDDAGKAVTTKQDSFSDINIVPDIFLTAEELAHYASKMAEEDLKSSEMLDASLLLQQVEEDGDVGGDCVMRSGDGVRRGVLDREDNSLEDCKDTLNILSYINDSTEDALQLDPLEVEELQMLADSTIFADPATEDSFRLDRP